MRRILLITLAILSAGVFAQEKAEVSVKIMQDGKVLKDTTYSYEDIESAEHAIKMIEIMGDMDIEKHMQGIAMDNSSHKKMIFVSEDGDVQEFKGEGMTWVSSESDEDSNSQKKYKVVVKEGLEEDDDMHFFDVSDGENIIINEDNGEVKVFIRKTGEGENISVKKEVIVISGEDDNVAWDVKKGDEGQVIIISEDGKIVKEYKLDGDDDVSWTSKEGDDDIDVIVIKKEKVEKGDKMEVKVTIDDKEKEVKAKTGKTKKDK